MKLETGSIVTGKVTGITKFGAFVTIAPGKSGLVHISEIANTYVNDVHDFLTEGQDVEVKIINIDDAGRINLSIKAALPAPEPAAQKQERPAFTPRKPAAEQKTAPRPQFTQNTPVPDSSGYVPQTSGDAVFEDKLKRFMQDSDSKMAGVRQYAERKTSRRRGK